MQITKMQRIKFRIDKEVAIEAQRLFPDLSQADAAKKADIKEYPVKYNGRNTKKPLKEVHFNAPKEQKITSAIGELIGWGDGADDFTCINPYPLDIHNIEFIKTIGDANVPV